MGEILACDSPSVAALDFTLITSVAAVGQGQAWPGLALSSSPQQPAGEAAASVFSAAHK